ncbi:putative salicylate hydroxylase [Cercophora samala]|uniref:Salicylate hydroxylase n=1 Tax=Cercophora samala TaxID=330535 RepID=A0AA40DCK5_9PEZI|nr:putative salicylate hydroxylase [Cercophora samala]
MGQLFVSRPVDGQPRRAAVIGAGIAGLSAAIALRRAGWHVIVYEKSQFKNEIGAAITITPNATLVLERLGFDFSEFGGVPNELLLRYDAADLSLLQKDYYGPDSGAEWSRFWSVHRVDLHNGLRKLAIQQKGGIPGPPADVKLGHEITGVDCETGRVDLKDGRREQYDLVVIADGAHSRLIEDFTGKPSTVHRTGRSIYRWLVSMADVNADPVLQKLYADPEGSGKSGFVAWVDKENRILWVSYKCRGGKVLNNAVVHDTQTGEGEEDLWQSPVSREQVLRVLRNFHPSVQKMVSMTAEDGIKAHHLYKREPLASFVRGKTLVMGDAAHVMMPTHAAGASVAIETAATLETLFDFSGLVEKDTWTMDRRLEMFDKLRVPRCNLAMLSSNAGPEWLHVPGVEDEIRKYYSGPLPPAGAMPYSSAFRDVLFKHDEYRAARDCMDKTAKAFAGRDGKETEDK